jgi:hypothetical protein
MKKRKKMEIRMRMTKMIQIPRFNRPKSNRKNMLIAMKIILLNLFKIRKNNLKFLNQNRRKKHRAPSFCRRIQGRKMLKLKNKILKNNKSLRKKN